MSDPNWISAGNAQQAASVATRDALIREATRRSGDSGFARFYEENEISNVDHLCMTLPQRRTSAAAIGAPAYKENAIALRRITAGSCFAGQRGSCRFSAVGRCTRFTPFAGK